MEKIQKILKKINGKGWNVYRRGEPNAEIDLSATYQMGPAKILEKGMCYLIMPRIENPNDQAMVQDYMARHKLLPKIRLPRKGLNKEQELCPGTEICFFGFELQAEKIRLHRTFLPYDVFLEALDTLEDITI